MKQAGENARGRINSGNVRPFLEVVPSAAQREIVLACVPPVLARDDVVGDVPEL
jgi:hypothetical protein